MIKTTLTVYVIFHKLIYFETLIKFTVKYNKINYRNISSAKVIIILIMETQYFFLMFFSGKTLTLMPLSKLRISWNNKLLEKCQIRWKQMLVLSIPSRNKVLVIAVEITQKLISKFHGLSNFAWFLYLLSNILSRIVDVYYSLGRFVFVGDSFKTVIISFVCKEILFKNILKTHTKNSNFIY